MSTYSWGSEEVGAAVGNTVDRVTGEATGETIGEMIGAANGELGTDVSITKTSPLQEFDP